MQASALQANTGTSTALTLAQSVLASRSQQLVPTQSPPNNAQTRHGVEPGRQALASSAASAKPYNPNTPRGSYVNLLV